MTLRRGVPALVAGALVLAIAGAGAAVAPAAGPFVCSGKFRTPGLLNGTYPDGVVVKGVCAVKTGQAHVIGTLTVTKGSALGAAFGAHHSRLTVTGNLVVDAGGVAILGCKANPNGTGMPCLDDKAKVPKLTSHPVISGNIVAKSAVGVLIHNTTIGGNYNETGGGGGVSCNPPKTGLFAAIKLPVFSDIEDAAVKKNVVISGLETCWLGLARDKIGGSVAINNNTLADPDGIEVLANQIKKNLGCAGNGHPAAASPPGAQPVYDSAEANPTAMAIYPRVAEPNTVGGTRSGQCTLSSPSTPTGAGGPGPF
jgi:hypothetical protein